MSRHNYLAPYQFKHNIKNGLQIYQLRNQQRVHGCSFTTVSRQLEYQLRMIIVQMLITILSGPLILQMLITNIKNYYTYVMELYKHDKFEEALKVIHDAMNLIGEARNVVNMMRHFIYKYRAVSRDQ